MDVWQNNELIPNKQLRGSVKVAKGIIEERLKRFRHVKTIEENCLGKQRRKSERNG